MTSLFLSLRHCGEPFFKIILSHLKASFDCFYQQKVAWKYFQKGSKYFKTCLKKFKRGSKCFWTGFKKLKRGSKYFTKGFKKLKRSSKYFTKGWKYFSTHKKKKSRGDCFKSVSVFFIRAIQEKKKFKERWNNNVSVLGELFFQIRHCVLRIISGIFDLKQSDLGGKRII